MASPEVNPTDVPGMKTKNEPVEVPAPTLTVLFASVSILAELKLMASAERLVH